MLIVVISWSVSFIPPYIILIFVEFDVVIKYILAVRICCISICFLLLFPVLVNHILKCNLIFRKTLQTPTTRWMIGCFSEKKIFTTPRLFTINLWFWYYGFFTLRFQCSDWMCVSRVAELTVCATIIFCVETKDSSVPSELFLYAVIFLCSM